MERFVESHIENIKEILDKRRMVDYYQYRNEFLDILENDGWNVYRPDEAEIVIGNWLISITFDDNSYHYLALNTIEPQTISFNVKVEV